MASNEHDGARASACGSRRADDKKRGEEGSARAKGERFCSEAHGGGIWPSADYQAQVDRLREAVGEQIYLAELRDTDTQLGVQVTDRPFLLLGVIDFPRPDPARGLAPHLILLDDGRGVNLGRIARISRRPFQPAADEVLYLDCHADQTLLFAGRRLSQRFIAERAHVLLGQVLGRRAQAPQSQIGEVSPDQPSSHSRKSSPEGPLSAQRDAVQQDN